MFPVVIVITHLDIFKDLVDHVVLIERDDLGFASLWRQTRTQHTSYCNGCWRHLDWRGQERVHRDDVQRDKNMVLEKQTTKT